MASIKAEKRAYFPGLLTVMVCQFCRSNQDSAEIGKLPGPLENSGGAPSYSIWIVNNKGKTNKDHGGYQTFDENSAYFPGLLTVMVCQFSDPTKTVPKSITRALVLAGYSTSNLASPPIPLRAMGIGWPAQCTVRTASCSVASLGQYSTEIR